MVYAGQLRDPAGSVVNNERNWRMLRRLTELAGFASAKREKAAQNLKEKGGKEVASGEYKSGSGEKKSNSTKKKKRKKRDKGENTDKKQPFNFENATKARRKIRDRVRPGLKDIRSFYSFKCKCGHVIDFEKPGVKEMLKKAEVLCCSKCDRKLHRDFEGVSLKSNVMGGSAYDVSFPDDCERFEVPGTKLAQEYHMRLDARIQPGAKVLTMCEHGVFPTGKSCEKVGGGGEGRGESTFASSQANRFIKHTTHSAVH